jgi:RNA polymerase sigma factor (sigma-70 family)
MSPLLLHAVVRVADARTPDSELLGRFAATRDSDAFEELVRRHGPLVWAVCRQLLAHQADAEDAFQAVFLALVRSASAIRAGCTLPAWLHGVAVRVAAKARRTASRRKQREQRAAVPEADSSVPDAAWAALMSAVHEEVQRLPDAERTAFVLCDLEGVHQPDAAARLGWPLGTLSGRLCKARQKLLERLTRRGITPGALAIGGLAVSAGSVPAVLLDKVSSFPAAVAAGISSGAISSTVASLAHGLVEGVTMRTKLMVAALVVAGALGLTGGAMVLSKAGAQTGGGSGRGGGSIAPFSSSHPDNGSAPPGAVSPVAADEPKGGPPAGGAPPKTGGFGNLHLLGGNTVWEYKFVDRETMDRDTFEKTLTQLGKEGWEYVGSEELQRRKEKEDPRIVRVFKRQQGGNFPFGGFPGGVGGWGVGGGVMPGMGGGGGAGMVMPGGNPFGGGGGGRAGGWGAGPGGAGANQFQVFMLKHVVADDVIPALQKAFPTANLKAVAEKASNSIVILSVDANAMKDIAKLIEEIDTKPTPKSGTGPGMSTRPPGSGMPMGGASGGSSMGGPPGGMSGGASTPSAATQTTVVALKHASAEELAGVLSRVFANQQTAVQKFQITADQRSNQIIIRSDAETAMEVMKLVEKLDVPVQKR